MKSDIRGNAPTHPLFLEIRAFALKSKQEQDTHSSLASHIHACDYCKETYANICEYEPELNQDQRIIAAELWEGVWQDFQSRLPGHLDKLLQAQAQQIMKEMERSVVHELFAHLTAVERDLEAHLRKNKERQTDIKTLHSNLCTRKQNLLARLTEQIGDQLDSLYAELIRGLQLGTR